ncbi:biotin/lipoyl-containing protein [Ruegeria sp. EL01]|uniref:biotin/lipoyl-containing protein n=1 Tax=Ruegeria sp. EL01 TaxID=2107578 RepID=UPI000EA80BD3|nr:biotin/lipoyl-containing protein [Ruegeria sp. EL01]
MSHEIIMPALGMAQDTGLIVTWRKAAGEFVAADDVLLEVETDKSVMEVEAGHDGYIAELRAEAGEEIPVGDVIAVITADKPDAPIQRRSSSSKELPSNLAVDEQSETGTVPKADSRGLAVGPERQTRCASKDLPVAKDRIFASPKARRLAAERGLDLGMLVADDRKQPYHVTDLDLLAALGKQSTADYSEIPDRIEASVTKAGFDGFRKWLVSISEERVDDLAVLAAFAAASMRAGGALETVPLVVEVQKPLAGRTRRFADPDFTGLAKAVEPDINTAPALILRDLTGLAVTSVRFGTSPVPTVTISDQDDAYRIVLEASARGLEQDVAIKIVHELSARLQEPLRQLL